MTVLTIISIPPCHRTRYGSTVGAMMADDRPNASDTAGLSALLGFGESAEEGFSSAAAAAAEELDPTAAARGAVVLEVARASAAISERASPAEQTKILAACARLAQACETERPINWLKHGKTYDHLTAEDLAPDMWRQPRLCAALAAKFSEGGVDHDAAAIAEQAAEARYARDKRERVRMPQTYSVCIGGATPARLSVVAAQLGAAHPRARKERKGATRFAVARGDIEHALDVGAKELRYAGLCVNGAPLRIEENRGCHEVRAGDVATTEERRGDCYHPWRTPPASRRSTHPRSPPLARRAPATPRPSRRSSASPRSCSAPA